jgi:5-(carboxyamino)imidazole ribonucleotide synthase
VQVGILGGGQLGRMLALAGRPLGLRFRFLEPKMPAPVDDLGTVVRAAYHDPFALDRFAEGLDVVTYEFENVPVESALRLEARVPVHPMSRALEVGQDRVAEKEAFAGLEIPTAPFRGVDSLGALRTAACDIGFPLVLKTRRLGYDGKGQAIVEDADGLEEAWRRLGSVPLLAEAFVRFRRELSIVACRGYDGRCAFYPVVENEHRAGILVRTTAPAPGLSSELQEAAEGYARKLLEALGYVGVIAIELFDADGGLMANELAPRVHNSGHWTQDGAETSQFENHLRAVCGFSLGSTSTIGPTVMLNLLGAIPDPGGVLAIPGAHLHLYDKAPRPGRKVGHVNVRLRDPDDVARSVAEVEALLER